MFVTLEGPEGAGKSSVIRMLSAHLESLGQATLVTREPGDGSLGRRIREILLGGGQIDPKAELFLFLADRAQHVEDVIRPALREGKTVLCDRYIDSTVAYQGYGRKFDIELLRSWNRFSTAGLMPDLTILLDIESDQGLSRVENKDRLDSEPLEFHQAVRQGFLCEAKLDPGRWILIDASASLEQVTKATIIAVLERQARIT